MNLACQSAIRSRALCSLCCALLLLVACANHENVETRQPAEGKADLEKIYPVSITQPEPVLQGKELKLRIQGHLPSPAYKFREFRVAISRNLIEITPLASYDKKKTVVQMLVPFDEVCSIKGVDPGHYEVKVLGRSPDAAVVTNITVQK